MDNAVTRPGLKFGFIGVGNMGGALARAVRRNVPGDHLTLANRTGGRAGVRRRRQHWCGGMGGFPFSGG